MCSILSDTYAYFQMQRGNSLVLSAPSPTPPATQPAGIMQTSIPVSPQSVPVFRPPYPPNYFPYSNYYPPFYVPPAIHQFLSHTGFPQQPPTGNVYVPTAATAAGVKLSHPQYKPGNNTGNSGHIGILPGYGSYSTSQVGYSPSSAVNAGSSTANVDLAASQLKENNIYTNRQQVGFASHLFSLSPYFSHIYYLSCFVIVWFIEV